MEGLTFGIELEFIAICKIGCFDNVFEGLVAHKDGSEPFGVTPGHAIWYFMNMAGVPATGWEEDIDFENEGPSYSKWMVHSDSNYLSGREGEQLPPGYYETSIEISTRVLSFHGANWQSEIQNFLQALDDMKKAFRCDFILNDSTGLHVHIGNGRGRTVPYNTAKRIAQLCTAFESRIDGLHRANRIKAPECKDKPFSSEDSELLFPPYNPLSWFHDSMAHEGGQSWGNNVFGWLADLEHRKDYTQLHALNKVWQDDDFLTGHNCVINFDNSVDQDAMKTIEFRQHCGTLDRVEIVVYVAFLATLINYCHSADDSEFVYLLTQCTDPTFNLDDFLVAIGCSEDILSHYVAGGAPDLGMLPSHIGLTRGSDQLQGLTEINDFEQTALSEEDAVQQRIDVKYTGGYYGLDPTAGRLPVDQRDIQWMLACAYNEADGAFSNELRQSQARLGLFKRLAQVYEGLDSSLDAKQTAMISGFADWMNKYPALK